MFPERSTYGKSAMEISVYIMCNYSPMTRGHPRRKYKINLSLLESIRKKQSMRNFIFCLVAAQAIGTDTTSGRDTSITLHTAENLWWTINFSAHFTEIDVEIDWLIENLYNYADKAEYGAKVLLGYVRDDLKLPTDSEISHIGFDIDRGDDREVHIRGGVYIVADDFLADSSMVDRLVDYVDNTFILDDFTILPESTTEDIYENYKELTEYGGTFEVSTAFCTQIDEDLAAYLTIDSSRLAEKDALKDLMFKQNLPSIVGPIAAKPIEDSDGAEDFIEFIWDIENAPDSHIATVLHSAWLVQLYPHNGLGDFFQSIDDGRIIEEKPVNPVFKPFDESFTDFASRTKSYFQNAATDFVQNYERSSESSYLVLYPIGDFAALTPVDELYARAEMIGTRFSMTYDDDYLYRTHLTEEYEITEDKDMLEKTLAADMENKLAMKYILVSGIGGITEGHVDLAISTADETVSASCQLTYKFASPHTVYLLHTVIEHAVTEALLVGQMIDESTESLSFEAISPAETENIHEEPKWITNFYLYDENNPNWNKDVQWFESSFADNGIVLDADLIIIEADGERFLIAYGHRLDLGALRDVYGFQEIIEVPAKYADLDDPTKLETVYTGRISILQHVESDFMDQVESLTRDKRQDIIDYMKNDQFFQAFGITTNIKLGIVLGDEVNLGTDITTEPYRKRRFADDFSLNYVHYYIQVELAEFPTVLLYNFVESELNQWAIDNVLPDLFDNALISDLDIVHQPYFDGM